jgi:hypothetical protein
LAASPVDSGGLANAPSVARWRVAGAVGAVGKEKGREKSERVKIRRIRDGDE